MRSTRSKLSAALFSVVLISQLSYAVAPGSGKYFCNQLLNNPFPIATMSALGSLRAAISIYYGDTEGTYPTSLDQLVPKYIPAIPPCTTSLGTKTGVQYYSNTVSNGDQIDPSKILGTGKWGYVNNPATWDAGLVFVDYKGAIQTIEFGQNNNANLGTLRSAISIYYGDTEGVYPPNLGALVPKYIRIIPKSCTCQKGCIRLATNYPNVSIHNTGGWGYVPTTGEVFLDSNDRECCPGEPSGMSTPAPAPVAE